MWLWIWLAPGCGLEPWMASWDGRVVEAPCAPTRRVVTAAEGRTEYTWEYDGRLVVRHTYDGPDSSCATQWTYDDDDRPLTKEVTCGADVHLERWTYVDDGDTTQITYDDGDDETPDEVRVETYDGGRLVREQFDGFDVTYSYDGRRLVSRQYDDGGETWTWERGEVVAYDFVNRSESLPGEFRWNRTFAYARGHRVRMTEAHGYVDAPPDADVETITTWDGDRIVEVVRRDHLESDRDYREQWSWGDGRAVEISGDNGDDGTIDRITRRTYDRRDNVLTEDQPDWSYTAEYTCW